MLTSERRAGFTAVTLAVTLLAPLAHADVFVVSREPDTALRRYAGTGQSLGYFPADQPVRSEGLSSLTTGPDGNLYVLSNILGYGDIIRIDPARATAQWLLASDEWNLTIPGGLAIAPDGRIFAGRTHIQSQPNSPPPGIVRFNPANARLVPVVTFADPNTQLGEVRFGPGNTLYVSRGGVGIERYDATTGAPLGTLIPSITPRHFLFGPDGALYVAHPTEHSIVAYDPQTGERRGDFIPAGLGGLGGISDFTFGQDGLVYVNSRDVAKVFRYSPSGEFLDVFASYDKGPSGDRGIVEIAHVPEPSALLWAAAGTVLGIARRSRPSPNHHPCTSV